MISARRCAVIISAIVLSFIIIFQLYVFIDQNRIISGDDLENYSQTYVNTYRNLSETYIHPGNRTYLEFYNEYPYFIKAVISTKHGAGLEFIPSIRASTEIEQTDTEIEDYFFNSSTNPYVLFGPITGSHVSIGNLSIIGMAPFKEISDGSSILLWNLRVNDRIYNYVIVKGDNRKKCWTNQMASEEASVNFKNDLIHVFTMSEEFRKYLAQPALSDIANRILDNKHKGSYTNNYLLYIHDYGELYNVAKEYGINTQFADDLYKFNEGHKEIPSLWEQYNVSGIIIDIVLAIIIIPSILFILSKSRDLLFGKRRS